MIAPSVAAGRPPRRATAGVRGRSENVCIATVVGIRVERHRKCAYNPSTRLTAASNELATSSARESRPSEAVKSTVLAPAARPAITSLTESPIITDAPSDERPNWCCARSRRSVPGLRQAQVCLSCGQ